MMKGRIHFSSKKTAQILAFLLLLIIPNIFYFFILHEKKIVTVLVNNLLLFSLSVLFLKHRITRLVGYILIFIVVVSNTLEIFSLYFYKEPFNVAMALSFLSTNSEESLEMSGIYWYVYIFLLIYFFSIIFFANKIKQDLTSRQILFLVGIFLIIPLYRILTVKTPFDLNEKLYEKTGESDIAVYLKQTPLPLIAPFVTAQHYLNIVQKSNSEGFRYPHFTIRKNNTRNIIVIIGESARRDALSLYGCPTETTPLIEKRISNLLIYDSAVAPADFTNLAIALILSKQIPSNNFSVEKNEDNVISLANASQLWKTYWISNQERLGKYSNLFANINSRSEHKYWTEAGSYDEATLPLLNQALSDKEQKRLIFIHLEGSHPEAGDRYPRSFERLHQSGSSTKDKYYNSIAYTDYIIDKIINRVANDNSIVIYFSDHGQSFTNGEFRHSFTKKGIEVPFFIWHSNAIDSSFRKSGRIKKEFSTTNLYNILVELMGIEGLPAKNENDSLLILKGNLLLTSYNKLDPGL